MSKTINQILKEKKYPLRRTRIMELIHNGTLHRMEKLPPGENYILAWRGSDGAKSKWLIDDEEMQAWLDRAKRKYQ